MKRILIHIPAGLIITLGASLHAAPLLCLLWYVIIRIWAGKSETPRNIIGSGGCSIPNKEEKPKETIGNYISKNYEKRQSSKLVNEEQNILNMTELLNLNIIMLTKRK